MTLIAHAVICSEGSELPFGKHGEWAGWNSSPAELPPGTPPVGPSKT